MRALRLIGSAFSFQAKHPVLRAVTVLLLIAPVLLRRLIARFIAVDSPLLIPETPAWQQPLLWATLLLLILTSILELWGVGSVLITGRRLLGHPAGRSRRSLLALITESVRLVPALFLTSILRLCTIFLLLIPAMLAGFFLLFHKIPHESVAVASILLALPAIFYALHTSFYAVVIAGEGIAYREALRRSRHALRGRTGALTTTLLVLFALTLGPGILLDAAFSETIPTTEFTPRAWGSDVIISIVEGIGTLIATLALTVLYSSLRSHTIENASVPAAKKNVKKKKAVKK